MIPVLAAAFIVAAAIVAAAYLVAAELRAAREQVSRGRALTILQAFASGIEAARADPRALLVWQPLAQAVRTLFPDECASLDAAAVQRWPIASPSTAGGAVSYQSERSLRLVGQSRCGLDLEWLGYRFEALAAATIQNRAFIAGSIVNDDAGRELHPRGNPAFC